MEYNAQQLAKMAIEARKLSYSPYSHFAVGAALMAKDGRIFSGGNIENAAYSVCNCAERTALFKAVSEGAKEFVAIAVSGGADTLQQGDDLPLCTPCGVCRQALYEFAGPDLPVILAKGKGEYEETTLGGLLPRGFGPKDLE